MKHIEVSCESRAHMRLAPSPLWETVAAVRLLAASSGVPFLYRTWAQWALASYGSDPAVGRLLEHARSWPGSDRMSTALLPVPVAGGADFETELSRLRETSRMCGSGVLEWICDGLEIVWSCAIAPAWPRILTALEEDILYRAKILVSGGVDALLATLHPKIRWDPPYLIVGGGSPEPSPARVVSNEMVAVPVIFCGDRPFVFGSGAGALAVGYQSRGVAALLEQSEEVCREVRETTSGLEKLVGPAKADILVAVQIPMTTTALAVRLALAPSTVSKHVHTLCEWELITRRRVGKSVYYGLSARGTALIDAMR